MSNLSELGFRYRAAVLLIVVLAMIYGVASYFTLPAREDPTITIREAVVVTAHPGMDATRVETLITTPLAEAIKTMPEVDEVRATSMEGQSIIHAEVAFATDDLDQAWDELDEKVEETVGQFPEGTMAPIINDEFGDVAVITLALQSADFPMDELGDLAEHVRDQLYTIPGTKRVDILGRPQERVYIEMSNAVLAQLGVPLDAVAAALAQQNVVAPGGAIETESRRLSIEPSGAFETLEDVRNLYLDLGPAGTIRLGDYAQVSKRSIDPPLQRAYFNGDPAIVFAISMDEAQSVINYADRAQETIDDVRQSLPAGITLETMTWQAEQVKNAVYGVSFNVLQTLAIVLATMILFLGLRTGLVIGAVVPAVVLITLAIMGMYGIKLERMSLATIVIALGLLVDNGIVIAEDFEQRLAEGIDRRKAIGQTGGELAGPLLASTLTIILVFLPLMLAQQESGEYTRNISLVILIALSSSWLIAVTVIPTLCYWFARPPEEQQKGKIRAKVDETFDWGSARYEKLLRWALAHRKLYLGGMAALFAIAAASLQLVPQQFFPSSDRAQILVYADMPVGTSSVAMDEKVQAISEFIDDDERYPDFDSVASYSGFGGPRFVLSLAPSDPAPNRGFLVINAKDAEVRDAGVEQLRQDMAVAFPDTRMRIAGMFLGPSDPNVIQVQVRGPDPDVLLETGDRLAGILREVEGTIDIFSDWEEPSMQYRVEVDQAAARAAGVTSADVSRALTTYFSGQSVGVYRDGDDLAPIVIRAPEIERTDPARLEAVTLVGAEGAVVQLGEVAMASLVPQRGRIQSENLIKTLTVEARPTSVTPQDMVPMVQDKLDELEAMLPPGHHIEWDGIIAESSEGTSALLANLPLMMGLIVIMLVIQFGAFRQAGVVLLVVPLGVIGAAAGLHIMQADFGFMVILGLFALFGIIINNAIVLVDRCEIERSEAEKRAHDEGKTRDDADVEQVAEAVVQAGMRRFRPILMTTITTILGLLPLIIGQDVLFYGLASAIAFGLVFALAITLGAVPVLYAWFFGAQSASSKSGK